LTYRVWLDCRALAMVTGRWRGCTAQPWDHPLTHRGEPTAVSSAVSFSGPCLSCQGSTCFALASSRGEGQTTRRPVSSPHTPSLDPTPLLCEAKLSEAKLWPCPTPSLPPSLAKPPGTHAPAATWRARAQAAPSRRLGSGRAWRKQGAKTREEDRRGEERGVGAAKGPARVHVTRQGHRRHGQGKRATTQAPPALDDYGCASTLPGDVLYVLVCAGMSVCGCVCEGAQFVRLCMD
jgi:hypothetical protein